VAFAAVQEAVLAVHPEHLGRRQEEPFRVVRQGQEEASHQAVREAFAAASPEGQEEEACSP